MRDSVRTEIERYLAGGMTPEEAASFLNGLRQDKEAMAWLGGALEQQALVFDSLRARAACRHDRTSAVHRTKGRRRRAWRDAPMPAAAWIAGLAAAVMGFAVLYALVPRKGETPTLPPGIPEPVTAGTPSEDAHVPARLERPPVLPEAAPAPTPPAAAAGRPEAPEADVPPGARAPHHHTGTAREVPGPSVPPPVIQPAGSTAAAVATVEMVDGEVVFDDGSPVAAGRPLFDRGGLRTVGGGSTAVLRFPDGTRIEAGGDTVLRGIRLDGGKRLAVAAGAISAEVPRQPPNRPMAVFTPHGEALVLGTSFRLAVDSQSTRLEVTEGRVRLKRTSDGKSVDVAAGHYAVAGQGIELAARQMPIDEILLLPQHGAILGREWKQVKDPDAFGGLALENLRTSNRFPDGVNADASRVTFAFRAEANRIYTVWIRGRTLAAKDQMPRDAVFLEWPEAQLAETPGVNKGKGGNQSRALFNGFMHRQGYWWVGGDADGDADASSPVTVRFPRPGWQTMMIYAYEPPVRINAVWLSTSRKTRPPDSSKGPR